MDAVPNDPPTPVGDIEDRADIEVLVRAFYEEAFADPMIGYLFTDVAQLDLASHLPVICSYWETILLGTGSYGGGAFVKHARLHARSPLRGGHFRRWTTLWSAAVDARFAGPRAELAKATGTRVAAAFSSRLAGRTPPGGGAADEPPLTLPVQIYPAPRGD